jgi:hypothetical protein
MATLACMGFAAGLPEEVGEKLDRLGLCAGAAGAAYQAACAEQNRRIITANPPITSFAALPSPPWPWWFSAKNELAESVIGYTNQGRLLVFQPSERDSRFAQQFQHP